MLFFNWFMGLYWAFQWTALLLALLGRLHHRLVQGLDAVIQRLDLRLQRRDCLLGVSDGGLEVANLPQGRVIALEG